MRLRGFKFWSEANWAVLTLGPHGLFGLPTPSAELAYRKQFGYGVTRRVEVLRHELAGIDHPSNDLYLKSLSTARRASYLKALYGDKTAAGCAQPGDDVVLRLGLPDGGELGDGFADAVSEASNSDVYRNWEARVVKCMGKSGIDVPDDDLVNVSRPLLKRLLDLAGSAYTVDDRGQIHYDLTTTQAFSIPAHSLKSLHADEMRIAAVEVTCRENAGSGAQRAVDRASADLVAKNRYKVAQLRRALEQMKDNNG